MVQLVYCFQLGEEAGVPPGVVNVITGTDSSAIGKVLCESPAVAKISFTGSTGVGKVALLDDSCQSGNGDPALHSAVFP